MKITIVLPTYDEAENLPNMVAALCALPLDLRVLVVDDNSPDGTGRIADELAARFPDRIEVIHRTGKRGYGGACLEGFAKALAQGAEVVGQMDCDFSHDPALVPALAAALAHADVALGSRYVAGGSLDERWPLWRKRLSAFGNLYARTILGFPLNDVTTGFRMWRRETLMTMPLERVQSGGYVFLVELAYVAHRLGFRFAQVPIHFAERVRGESKMSFRIQVEAALRVWGLKWRYRRLRPA
jgi:dolichol-phosphate mannosyltransferase